MNRLDALQRVPCRSERPIAFGQPDSLLHGSVILFHDVVEVLALAQPNPPRQGTPGFHLLNGGRVSRVLVDIHDTWHGIAGCRNGMEEKAFGRCRIALRRQQKLDRLAGGIDGPVQVPVFPLNSQVGLIDSVDS